MKITSAEKNKKNQDRMDIYIDGKFSFTISNEDYLRLSLYEDKELTHEDIEYITRDICMKEAKVRAIRYISLKLRCEAEVSTKLYNEGFDITTIENVVSELKSMGYIDDKQYVSKFILNRIKLKPKSKRLIMYELKSKGIDDELVNSTFDSMEYDEFSMALKLVQKKFANADMTQDKYIKKIYSFLMNRGFELNIISKCIDTIKTSSKGGCE